jgi:hypothetical protein
MKIYGKYLILAAATSALALTSCQSDNDVAGIDEGRAKVIVNADLEGMSRVTTEGTGNAWTSGDQFTVKNLGPDAVDRRSVATYLHDGNKFDLTGSDYMLWSKDSTQINQFQAWYPSDVATTTFTSFVVNGDQSDQAKLRKCDWMTAEANVANTNKNKLNLTFNHKLAKININVTSFRDQYNGAEILSNAVYSLPTTLSSIGETMETGATSVKAYIRDDNNASSTSIALNANAKIIAIMPLGSYATGDQILSIMVGSDLLKVLLPSALTLETGKEYTFSIEIGKDTIKVLSVSVGDWTETNVTTVYRAEES